MVSLPSLAQVTLPEKVNIGLYYGSSAMPIVNIKAQEGVSIGSNESGSFNTLCEYVSQDGISVRKDSYFVKSGSIVLEFKQTDKSIPEGERFGPYHVQIGSSYFDKTALDQEIQNIKSKNIQAYPAYNGSWFIWTGLYMDSNSARQAIESTIKPVLGENDYTVIEPSAQRVQVAAGDEILLMFEGQSKFLSIKPKSFVSPALINVNGANFRGEVEVRRYSDSDMTIINMVPLEEYLYSVVGWEIGNSSPIEAIKAQAVASRTYAKNNLGKYSKWGFDMSSTTSDQAYGGYVKEGSNSVKGVDQTKGKVLMYNGKPASVFYFSTSGGSTEDVKNVWNSKGDFPYLTSVADKYEPIGLKYSKWQEILTREQIKTKLKAQGYDLGEILSVQAIEFSPAGRVTKLLITGTKDKKTFEKGACRTVLGLKSQWYTVSTDNDIAAVGQEGIVNRVGIGTAKVKTASGIFSIQSDGSQVFVKGADEVKSFSTSSSSYKFDGKGWGHGIGMSQNGAIGMARAGFTYDQILQWYFKGTYIE